CGRSFGRLATASKITINRSHSESGTNSFQAITAIETTATPKRKSSTKKDGNRNAAVIRPPALSRIHGSRKRKTAKRKLKLLLASVIPTTRKIEIAKQANRQRLSTARAACCSARVSFNSLLTSIHHYHLVSLLAGHKTSPDCGRTRTIAH